MTEDEWMNAVAQRIAAPTLYPIDPLSAAKAMLFDLYMLAADAPPDALMRFAAIPESTIAPLASALMERMHRGDFALRAAANCDVDNVLFLLIIHIRGLDEFIAQSRAQYGAVADPERAWAVEVGARE